MRRIPPAPTGTRSRSASGSPPSAPRFDANEGRRGSPVPLRVRERAGQLDRDGPVRIADTPTSSRELDEPQPLRIDREELLAHHTGLEGVARRREHDGAACRVLDTLLYETSTCGKPGAFGGRIDVMELR